MLERGFKHCLAIESLAMFYGPAENVQLQGMFSFATLFRSLCAPAQCRHIRRARAFVEWSHCICVAPDKWLPSASVARNAHGEGLRPVCISSLDFGRWYAEDLAALGYDSTSGTRSLNIEWFAPTYARYPIHFKHVTGSRDFTNVYASWLAMRARDSSQHLFNGLLSSDEGCASGHATIFWETA